MDSFLKFFLQRSFLVNLISVFVIVAGLYFATHLNRDLIPQLEFNMITVSAQLEGASAVEVEKHLTYPMEESLKSLPDVKKIQSNSQNGSTQINIRLTSNVEDIAEYVGMTEARIDSIKHLLPENVRNLRVARQRIDNMDMYNIQLKNFDFESELHYEWMKKVSDSLMKLRGIVAVEDNYPKRQLIISYLPEKLGYYGISTTLVEQLIAQNLRFSPVAHVDSLHNRYTVEIDKRLDTLEEIKDITIKTTRTGGIVRLKDLADVEYKPLDQKTIEYIDAERSISLEVYKDLHSDGVDLSNEIKQLISELNDQFPDKIEAHLLVDGSYLIKKQLKVLSNNALIGILLVVVVLWIFLGFRIALTTAIGLPIAYLGTILVLNFLNINIDLISVSAMILVVGILVDDSIIVSEKYADLLAEGLSSYEAAFRAAKELVIPVTGTVLTTMVAFSPLLFMKNEMTNVIYAIPVVMISTLAMSWVECFLFLPNHLHHFVKSRSQSKRNFFQYVENLYAWILRYAVKLRYLTVLLIFGFVGYSFYFAYFHIEKSGNISISMPNVSINGTLSKSDSLQETKEKIKAIEDIIAKFEENEMTYSYTTVGKKQKFYRDVFDVKNFSITAFLPESEAYPDKLIAKMIDKIKPEIEALENTEVFEEIKVGNTAETDKKENIVQIKVSGGDRLSFEKIEAEIFDALKGTENITDIGIDEKRYLETKRFELDKVALSKYGLTSAQLANQMRQEFTPNYLTDMRFQGESISVYTRTIESKQRNKDFSAIKVVSGNGISIPITYLGKWVTKRGISRIDHENLLRIVSVEVSFDQEKTKMAEIKDAVDKNLESLRESYPSYIFDVKQSDEQNREVIEWAEKVAVVCILSVLVVLMITLGSILQPVVVSLAIPFGLTGVIWSMHFHGMKLEIMTIIGIIGLAGVVVNDSLILVHTINELFKEKVAKFNEAIIQGSTKRLRAIILTTITTLAGVLPMAYGLGGESGFTSPLGFSMGWGLAMATVLSIFTLPPLLMIIYDFSRVVRWMFSLPKRLLRFLKVWH